MVTQQRPCREANGTLPDASGVRPVSGHKGTSQQRRNRLVKQEVVLQVEERVDGRWTNQGQKRCVLQDGFNIPLDEPGRITRHRNLNSTRQHQGLLWDFISSLASLFRPQGGISLNLTRCPWNRASLGPWRPTWAVETQACQRGSDPCVARHETSR